MGQNLCFIDFGLRSHLKVGFLLAGMLDDILVAKMLNVVTIVQNDESLRGHCTNERRVRKRDKKVRRDVI